MPDPEEFNFDNMDDEDQQALDLIDDEPYTVHVPDAECEDDIAERCSVIIVADRTN